MRDTSSNAETTFCRMLSEAHARNHFVVCCLKRVQEDLLIRTQISYASVSSVGTWKWNGSRRVMLLDGPSMNGAQLLMWGSANFFY